MEIDELRRYWETAPDLQTQFERLASQGTSNMMAGVPEIGYDDVHDIHWSLIEPQWHGRDYDTSRLNVMPAAYTRGYDVTTIARARGLAECLGSAVLVFPNTVLGEKPMYNLSRKERSVIANGNFEPIASRQASVIEDMSGLLGSEHINTIAFSLASRIGMATTRLAAERGIIDSGSLTMLEPVAMSRKTSQAKQAYLAVRGGRQINDSSLGAPDMKSLENKEIRNLPKWKFFMTCLMPPNRALSKGMGEPKFGVDLLNLMTTSDKSNVPIRVRIFSGDTSRIAQDSVLQSASALANFYMSGYERSVGRMTVPGGHEALGGQALFVMLSHLAANQSVEIDEKFFSFP